MTWTPRRLPRAVATRYWANIGNFRIDAREGRRYRLVMTNPPETALVRELRARIQDLEHQNTDLARQVADLERHNKELREAVAALLASNPPPSQASQKHEGRLW